MKKNAISIVYTVFSLILSMHLAYSQTKAFDQNQKLGRGINMGNALEAPNEGEWGVTLQESYFQIIAQKGFHSVRIPIRWSTHAMTTFPYIINESFFDRIDWAVQNALKNKLMVIINVHHYTEIFEDPAGNKARFLKIWEQIGQRYSSYSDSIIFEPLNEPNGNLTAELWNTYLAEAHDILRISNPDKTILVGIAEWGGIGGLNKLVLPINDDNLILTVHYYNPFQFTHQGAEWVAGSDAWLGTYWNNTVAEREIVVNEFQAVTNFASFHNIPVHIGEFGAYNKADIGSRALWTNYCSRLFEEKGFSWAYWEFCSGFGIYNATNNTWNQKLLDALVNLPMPDPVENYNGNMLFNGDFQYGKSNWSMYVNSSASANYNVSNNECKVTITSGGTENWHVELMNNSFKIENGKKYHIEFETRADKNRNIEVSIGQNSSPYNSYFGKQLVPVSTIKTKFVYEFTMQSPTDPSARFLFDLGKNTGIVYFYNVLVREAWPTGNKLIEPGNNFRIIPNPAKNYFRIEGGQVQSYRLLNLSGQVVIESNKIELDQNELNCSYLKDGTYLLQFTDSKGNNYSRKVIVANNK